MPYGISFAFQKEAAIEGVSEDKSKQRKKEAEAKKPWTRQRILDNESIPENLKLRACETLILAGSDAMKDYLKTEGGELL